MDLYYYSKTNYLLIDIKELKDYEYNNIFLIFPIHYQSIPKPIRGIIKKIIAKKAIVIATYGKMSYGNILCDTKKILQAKIVAAAIVPSKHTYILNDTKFTEYNKLDILINSFNNDKEINIKKTKKSMWASFFPRLRHHISVKIIKTNKCMECGICSNECEYISNGIINSHQCIRCLKCVYNCPYKALEFKLSRIMKRYFKKKKTKNLIIYIK